MPFSDGRGQVLRALPAVARASIPVAGVAWLGWPLLTILFYAWLELVLVSLDTAILGVRDRLGGDLFEIVLICAAVMMPVTVIAWYATVGLGWAGRIDYVLGVMQATSVRVAVALQVLVAVVYAIVREVEDDAEGWRFGEQMDLVQNRVLTLVLLALPLSALLAWSGLGMPGAENRGANTVAVLAVSAVWLVSDLMPERFNRAFAAVLATGKRT